MKKKARGGRSGGCDMSKKKNHFSSRRPRPFKKTKPPKCSPRSGLASAALLLSGPALLFLVLPLRADTAPARPRLPAT